MPMPYAYRHAGRDWAAFLGDVREVTGLPTDNTAYTAVEGVLAAFRRRLTPAQAVAFAQVLPAVPRAIFVAGWDVTAAPVPPGTRADWTTEAQGLRRAHNIAPDNVVEAVAVALRRSVRAADLDRTLAALPPFAAQFWDCPTTDPGTLTPRIG